MEEQTKPELEIIPPTSPTKLSLPSTAPLVTPPPLGKPDGTAATATPSDALDIDSLWTDTGEGDTLTETTWHAVLVGKPRNFFRTHPDPKYRHRTEMLIRKPENQIETEYYILAASMRGHIPEARPCILVTCIYRDGSLRLWPIPCPRDGERDNKAWISAKSAARASISKWVMMTWSGGVYVTRDAEEGYAPDPDWTKVPPYNELTRAAFGTHGVIQDGQHAVYRDVMGKPPLSHDDI